MKKSMLMTMLMMGMMSDNFGQRATYRNGIDNLKVEDFRAEYELIKLKQSNLSANERRAIVRYVENNS